VELVLPGYFEGKRIAEEAVSQHFGSAGAVLRPPAVHGTRDVGKYVKIPLGLVGVPLGALLSTSPMRQLAGMLGPVGDLMMPWVSVDDVAAAAVSHVMQSDDNEGGGGGGGGDGEDGKAAGGMAGPAVVVDWESITGAATKLFTALPPQVTLFWDGGCPLCTTEISYYKRIDAAQRVDWVDVHATPERLDPYGLDAGDAMRKIHAIDARGKVQIGVPAFIAVWEQLPLWNILPPVLRTTPLALPIASAAYSVFARYRLKITGRGRALEAGSACRPDARA